MLPSKFPSTRRGSQSVVRRATFGNDTGLVAVRYEKTVQAEPPIPVTSRHSVRFSRRPSTSSASSYQSHRPIVVAPPRTAVPPPTEEHPAFRPAASSSPSPSPRASPVIVEEWKRDSGVARTNSTSTSTIHEVEGEDECDEQPARNCVRGSASREMLVKSSPAVVPFTKPAPEDPFVDENSTTAEEVLTSVSTMSPVSPNARCATPPLASHSSATATPPRPIAVPAIKTKTINIPAPSVVESPVSTSSPSSPRSSISSSSRRLAKGISLRSGSRFRTPSLTQVLAPMQPLWRGSEPQSPALDTAIPEASGALEAPTASTSTAATTTASSPGISPSPSAASSREASPTTAAATETPGPKQAKNRNKNALSSSYPTSASRFWQRRDSTSTTTTTLSSDHLPFIPLDVSIPSESILDNDYFLNSVTFSNRGSIMFGAHDVAALEVAVADALPPSTPPARQFHEAQSPAQSPPPQPNHDDERAATPAPTTPTTPTSHSQARPSIETVDTDADDNKHVEAAAEQPEALTPPPNIRVLAADLEKESQKVRSLYDVGDGPLSEPGSRRSYCERLEPTPEASSKENRTVPPPGNLPPVQDTPASGSSSCLHYDLHKSQYEYPDELEDWQDLQGARVDRYGFITLPPRPGSRSGPPPSEVRSLPGSPRKKRSLLHKRDIAALSVHYGGRRTPTRKVSARSLNTQASELSASPSLRTSRSVIRQASNLLPHNRDRRWMDEAGEMLDSTPSLQDIVDEARTTRLNEVMKKKEWERSEKWRRMAKVIHKSGKGQGMEFEFDAENPKLIDRTWKGIPDRWRAAAWWSFLSTSAKQNNDPAAEEDIVADFHRLQLQSSPDDVQIDLDVPRTINRHIMFRRRYRGGQRLMFRVLHAISIYFPDTGYVQGMASLVATLLCYFDEEKCFVMLVRMWKHRGLSRLYRPGFEELMAAMKDFNDSWLNKDVAKKLEELSIDTTAYGTRWYLTLFNLSIPFAAQLRVWDVFLLLGDCSPVPNDTASESTKSEIKAPTKPSEYDVLHATSAALAQALREVIVDSDFENAMKALTSPIQIKDEDLLLKVMKAEWKAHHGKKKA